MDPLFTRQPQEIGERELPPALCAKRPQTILLDSPRSPGGDPAAWPATCPSLCVFHEPPQGLLPHFLGEKIETQ